MGGVDRSPLEMDPPGGLLAGWPRPVDLTRAHAREDTLPRIRSRHCPLGLCGTAELGLGRSAVIAHDRKDEARCVSVAACENHDGLLVVGSRT